MSKSDSNALMRRLLRDHTTLPAGAPFEVTTAEKYILCDPEYNHVAAAATPGTKPPRVTREALTAGFGNASFKGRIFVVKD